ncbi:MAG: hypothetical protein AB7E95_10115 [Kiritimatiellales bacterium]
MNRRGSIFSFLLVLLAAAGAHAETVEMSFTVPDLFSWITLGMMIGCGFFFPLAVAAAIRKGLKSE